MWRGGDGRGGSVGDTGAGEGAEPEAPDAVVLLGRGGYGDEPQVELDAMLAAVRATGRYARVEGAFVDSGGPAFPVVLRRLAEGGARRILIAPVFVPVDRSLREWLPRIVRRALKKQHLDSVVVLLAPALGDGPALGEAVARALRAAEGGADGQGVLPVRSSCLYPCNLGPLMVVYPDGTWYGALTEGAIERIVDEHFAGGRPVASLRRFADLAAGGGRPDA